MSSVKTKDSFLKGAFILGMAGILVKVMGAFFRIPLGNLIGAEGMAYYQAAYPVYTLFLTLATAGFPTALAKLVSETGLTQEQGITANSIFESTFLAGNKNKEFIVQQLMERLGVDESQANLIYEVGVGILATGILDKLKKRIFGR